ncbi:hypothetical protein N7507_004524 [Penicillium longicatenatum]|nr:hypothetical protein N7507_004524 [Penicillium longicatenatum]
MAPSEDEEDDYMSMVIAEPTQKESFTQRKRREQREAEARGRVPSNAERAAQEAARRDEALAKSTLDPSNKGFKMMAKLGFKAGDSLGKRDSETPSDGKPDPTQTRAEPLNLTLKDGRGGIGLDTEKKRKIREEAEEATKKIKRDEGDYRDRVREERELRRTEAQVRAAQKVAERLDLDAETDETTDTKDGESHTDKGADDDEGHKTRPKRVKPTSQVNVLYRGLVREYEEREREKQARHLLQTSLPSSFFRNPKLPGYDDEDLEREDKQAIGNQPGPYTAALEQELEEEDPELDAFNALEPSERLEKLVRHLRDTHRYCFWCKYQYETDLELEGCPGLTEEDHD